MAVVLLDDRAVIAVSGPEARSFLQGLITNDIAHVTPGRAAYAALLTPQGKILFDFIIAEQGDVLLLDCDRERRDVLIKRLSLYRLRAKVTIAARDDLVVMAAWNGRESASPQFLGDPRLEALGARAIAPSDLLPQPSAGRDAYLERRLGFGVPEGKDFGSDRMFALDADLDELHGIDFEKGCYVGQELTARMKHRGTARKRLLPIVSRTGEPLPPAPAPVTANGRDIGETAAAYGARGFALLRLDRLEELGDVQPLAGDVPVAVERPAWLFA